MKQGFPVVALLKCSLIRKPMCDDEPKDARKPPFKANEGLNALTKRSAGRMGTGFVERRIFVNKNSLNNW